MSMRRGQALTGLLFILPAIIFLSVFLIYPTIWTILLSFNDGRGLKFSEWVGFENYINLFTNDPKFLDLSNFPPTGAVFNNVLWVIFNTIFCVSLGLLIAVLADRVKYERIVKAVVFLPMAIAATAVAIIWLFVYSPNPDIGLLNAIITFFNKDFEPIAWTGRADTVNAALIVANIWTSTGFAMVVLSAALKGIPTEIIEASRVDGAKEFQVFRHITVPMLSLAISVVTITLIINVLKVFDIIYIMTLGGPGSASRVLAYTMYAETFQGGKAGYGSAVAVILLILVIPIMALNIRRFRSEGVAR
jgi:alpha-glucoside transport system permease protein